MPLLITLGCTALVVLGWYLRDIVETVRKDFHP
jgi:hypothetical protein